MCGIVCQAKKSFPRKERIRLFLYNLIRQLVSEQKSTNQPASLGPFRLRQDKSPPISHQALGLLGSGKTKVRQSSSRLWAYSLLQDKSPSKRPHPAVTSLSRLPCRFWPFRRSNPHGLCSRYPRFPFRSRHTRRSRRLSSQSYRPQYRILFHCSQGG